MDSIEINQSELNKIPALFPPKHSGIKDFFLRPVIINEVLDRN